MIAFLLALFAALVLVGAGLFAQRHATYYQAPHEEPLLGRHHEPERAAEQDPSDEDGA